MALWPGRDRSGTAATTLLLNLATGIVPRKARLAARSRLEDWPLLEDWQLWMPVTRAAPP